METNFEDDDDTHYCIKCHMTVNGLDNYVRHRQTGCRPSERKNAVTPDPPTPTVSYPEILNADAFFSSLELQSSAKSKSTGARSGPEEEKKFERRGEKRRKTRRYNEIDVPSPKEKLMTLPPVVTDLDDPTDHIGIPSLVGFPDIVPFTDKASTSTKIQSSGVSKPNDSDKKRENDEHQVWTDEDSDDIDENKVTSAQDESDTDEEFNYPHDDDTNDSQIDDIDQVDSYSETDEADDREYPPQAHTGGKWKPGQLLQHMTRENDDDIDHDDDQDNSRPAHTGGKWKPEQKINEDELEDDDIKDTELITRNSNTRQPPPGHTHGKWIPGAMTMPSEDGSVYWCSPCGRKLASKLIYNRHLRTDLHARRSIQEIEGDIKLPRSVGPLLRKKCRTRRQQILAMKRSETKRTIVDNKATKKRRCREKEFVRCEMCHARVRRIQLGKHLLSHYHCRVAGLNPCSPAARRFILENMANVVRQCPFQCSCCRFYCNTEETFLLHWRSNLHYQNHNDNESKYICVCCDFWCDDNTMMEEHLLSAEHRETVAMINGSVPIVIRRQRFLICHTCNRRFRYNFQLRLHAKDTGHPITFTASDEYQMKIHCNLCPQILKSQLALQRHQLTAHNNSKEFAEKIPMPYFCSFCSINFETARDAVLHRRTASHKQIVKNRKSGSIEGETVSPLQRDCGHCAEKQNNLLEYRRHLLQCHSDQCHKCLKCRKIFALSQDIARHIKIDNCIKKLPEIVQKSLCKNDKRKCTKCSFFTKSPAEFIFHQAIHEGPIEIDPQQASSSTSDTPPATITTTTTTTNANTTTTTTTTITKSSIKYRCSICNKMFTKGSLHNHIRRHTGEKLYSCCKCGKSFGKKSYLNDHANKCSPSSSSSLLPKLNDNDEKKIKKIKIRRRNFICLECNTGFYTKDHLRQHMLRHTGKNYKCGLPGCPTILRTESELKAHRALIHESVTDARKFQCNQCSYAAKRKTQLHRHQTLHKIPTTDQLFSCTHKGCNFSSRFNSHLKRHIRLHTGIKPYACPHCNYASNNIENLRKHVLSTSLHSGKTIYQCEKCKNYGTNFSKELRAHLMEKHSEEFPTPTAAKNYVAGIFSSQ